MSSFAALRAKAESAASSAKEKSNNFLDKRQSPSSSSTTARPPPSRPPPSSTADSATDRRLPPTASKAPPRPPPRQAEASTAPLPPPRSLPDQTSLPSRTSAPSLPSRDTPPPSYRATAAPQSSTKRLVGDGPAEKQQFFSLLDEYFANRGQHRVQSTSRGPIAPPLKETVAHVEPDEAPSAPTWARRPLSTATSGAGADFTMSHPPACIRSCSAEDACTDFLPEAVWRTEWYTSPAPQPPLMQQRNDIAWAGSMMQRGSEKSVVGMALFADLSQCWYRVSFFAGQPCPSCIMTKEARYAPRPAPLDYANAEWAHEVYGETIARFAEHAERSRMSIGDGECWTLAAEAIKSIDSSLPKPVPSISRTHGSLIYEGKATGKGKQVGRWRGGDTLVRRGDIVEWRKVTINTVNAPRGSWSTLGNPDHTAIIVSDAVPSRTPQDGQPLLPSELHSFEVIEQSKGKACERARYDLSAFSAGEVWVYRPCSMDQLGLGEMSAAWPPPVTAYETT